jgi:DNA recombination protein RmuC
MIEALLFILLVLSAASAAFLILLLRRQGAADIASALARLDAIAQAQERIERATKDEIARSRQETSEQARDLRQEVQAALKSSTDSLVKSIEAISSGQQKRLEDFAGQLNALRAEMSGALHVFKESQERRLTDSAAQLQQHSESFSRKLSEFGNASQESAKQSRLELASTLQAFNEAMRKQMSDFAAQLQALTESSQAKADALRQAMEAKLKELQTDNAAKLEEMRRTVDEKLQGTLEKRLGESFKLVSERLEQVHSGLGEMRLLASGVGDLKKVLTNVKTRGTWGEVQLGNLLDQILTADQYARNVATRPGARETVEFALKLPGRDEQDGKVVWLPIDAKFPKEDYERLVDAADRGDAAAVEDAGKALEARVHSQARDIRDKYIAPPHTTDFGLLYLPTEGLYAEVLRRPGLVDMIQRDCRVVVVGPTTLAALLNSLQMGFRTLAIQKRSSEVWKVLGAVKTEFGKFGDILEKVKHKLDETGNTIEQAAHRSRQIERKLKKVEALPASEAAGLLEEAETDTPAPDAPGVAPRTEDK